MLKSMIKLGCLLLTFMYIWLSAGAAWAAPQKSYRNSIGMDFVLVPAGSFMMGNEKPFPTKAVPHRVALSRPFYMQTTEVTRAQHEKLMGATPWKNKDAVKPDCGDCPAVRMFRSSFAV